MAPKKGTKRAQEAKVVPSPKKSKAESKFTPIIEGIQEADGLNETCRQMLLAAIPSSLGTPSNMRHEIQQSFVQMIGEALDEVEACKRVAFDEQLAKLQEVEAAKATLTQKLTDAQEALTNASSIVQSKKSALADQARALADAKAASHEKKEAQRTGDIAIEEANKLKLSLDKVMEADLKAIVAGEFGDADAGAHFKALAPFFSDLCLDDSLKTAMPITCVKPKGERGAFDNMVIEQLEKTFNNKASELLQKVEEAAPQKAERDAAAEAAETHVKESQALHQTAAEELTSAQTAEKNASNAVGKAKDELDAYEPERLKVVEAKEAKADILESFKQNVKGYFELLRDHDSTPATSLQDTANGDDGVQVSAAKLEALSEATKAEAPISVGGA